jgi:hypothetical protein
MSSTFAAQLKACCELVGCLSTEPISSAGNTFQEQPTAQALSAMCQKLADSPAQPKATLKKLLLKQEVRVDVFLPIKPTTRQCPALAHAAVFGRPVWLRIE